MNIVALKKSIGCQSTAANAMSASIGQKDREPVCKQELGVANHSEAVVAQAVKQDGGVAAWADGTQEPGTHNSRIGSGDGYILHLNFQLDERFVDAGHVLFCQRPARRTECGVGQINAADQAESEIHSERVDQPTQSAAGAHGRMRIRGRRVCGSKPSTWIRGRGSASGWLRMGAGSSRSGRRGDSGGALRGSRPNP